MPDNNVKLPDGSVVAFPENTSPDEMNSAVEQHLGNQGFFAGLKRGMGSFGVGAYQLLNAGDQALQKSLPESISKPLMYEFDNGSSPDAAELQRRAQVGQDAARDLKQKGEGTGVSGWLGEAVGNPLSWVPGDGLIGQGLASGVANSFFGPKTGDSTLDTRADQAEIEAPIDAASSLIAGKTMGKILGGAVNRLTPEKQALADKAESAGLSLTPGQKTGSMILQGMDKLLSADSAQPKQFTQLALQKAGVDAPAVTSTVLDKGFSDIGSSIGNITKNYNIPITPELGGALQGAVDNKLTDAEGNKISSFVDDIMKGAKSSDTPEAAAKRSGYLGINAPEVPQIIPGAHYQSMRSQIGDAARAAYKTGNTEYGSALNKLRGVLDDAMGAQLKPEEQAALADARQKYANLATVEGAWKPQNGGNVSPEALASEMTRQNKSMFKRGKGDLNDLAQSGLEFVDSSSPVKTKISEVGAGAGAGFLHGGIAGALAGAGLGLAGPYVGNKVYQSPAIQHLILNGIAPKGKALGEILAGRAAAKLSPVMEGAN